MKTIYKVWATDRDGEGHTTRLGEYEDIEDILIRVRPFRDDVVFTISLEEK